MYFANTHMHSTFSDGVFTPEELVRLGKKEGYGAMLLTDHDTVSGQHAFEKAARRAGILTMVGSEIGALCSFGRCHIVCVDFNTEDKGVRELMRLTSGCTTVLTKYLFEEGMENGTMRKGVTWQDVLDEYPSQDYLCNNHIFELQKKRGIYKDEDYEKFFADNFGIPKDRKYALERELGFVRPQVEEIIDIILKADGVPIVAHPTEKSKYFFKEETENFLKMGIKGFEVSFPGMTKEQGEFYNAVCDEKKLYKLGGTDHSGKLGGFDWKMAKNPITKKDGYTTKTEFMKLYNRELG